MIKRLENLSCKENLIGAGSPFPGEGSGRAHPSVPMLKGKLHRTEALPLQGAAWRRQGTVGTGCIGQGFILILEKNYGENTQSLEQPPQGCCADPVAEGFQV